MRWRGLITRTTLFDSHGLGRQIDDPGVLGIQIPTCSELSEQAR